MQCNIREVLFDICQYQAKYFSSPIHYYKNSIVQIFLLLIFLDLNAKFTTQKHRRSIYCLGFDKNPMKSFRRNRFFYSNTGHIYWLTHICTINLNKKGALLRYKAFGCNQYSLISNNLLKSNLFLSGFVQIRKLLVTSNFLTMKKGILGIFHETILHTRISVINHLSSNDRNVHSIETKSTKYFIRKVSIKVSFFTKVCI